MWTRPARPGARICPNGCCAWPKPATRTACAERRPSSRTKPGPLSLAINHKHHSSYGFVEQRTRAMLMAEILECPALGLISAAQCREEQRKPFTSVNPLAVAVYRACRNGCRHYLSKEKNHAA